MLIRATRVARVTGARISEWWIGLEVLQFPAFFDCDKSFLLEILACFADFKVLQK
jgi:hypothetical protein